MRYRDKIATTTYLHPEAHEELRKLAQKNRRSISSQLAIIIQDWMIKQGANNGAISEETEERQN